MPIKGVSEIRRLPRVGKVRLGVKVQGAKGEYPKAVDWFVVNADDSTSPEAAAKFHQAYGEKPRRLEILLPSNDPNIFFQQWYRRYGKSTGLVCKGDGEKATQVNAETGEMEDIACKPEECEWYAKKHCRTVGSLLFILPKVGMGCWQIDTGSFYSIVNLNSDIEFVRTLTGGRVAMLPLSLVIKPKEVQVEGKKKTVFVMSLAIEDLDPKALFEPRPTIEIFALPEPLTPRPDDLYPDKLYEKEVIEAEATPTVSPELDHAGARERVAAKRAARVAASDREAAAMAELESDAAYAEAMSKAMPQAEVKVVAKETKLSKAEAKEEYEKLKMMAKELEVQLDIATPLIEDWRQPPWTKERLALIVEALERNTPPKQEAIKF
jgi:hypothetical protein